MNKVFCDRCSKEIRITDDNLEVWDREMREDLNGAIWSVGIRGNFMNSKIDVCFACMIHGLKLLLKKAGI